MFLWVGLISFLVWLAFAGVLVYLYFIYGESATYYYGLVFMDVFWLCLSIGILDFFFSKYRKLYKTNIMIKGNASVVAG